MQGARGRDNAADEEAADAAAAAAIAALTSEGAPARSRPLMFVSMDMLLNAAANDGEATARCVATAASSRQES
jgi:hypothetical protein